MIDLTQSHDVLGAYHGIDFDNIRKKYRDPQLGMPLMC